jgi:hypothetical protein
MRTRVCILLLTVTVCGAVPLGAAPSTGAASIRAVPNWHVRAARVVQRLLRLAPKGTGDGLSPPKPDTAPLARPRCAAADCRT